MRLPDGGSVGRPEISSLTGYRFPAVMKINALSKILAVAAALPLVALAESPDDSSPSKQGVSGNKEFLDSGAALPSQDGIARRTDAVYIYKAGKPQKVEATMKAGDGIVVEPNGRVMWSNGKEVMLTEGQMVGFDGTLIKEPMAAKPDRNAVQGSSGARD